MQKIVSLISVVGALCAASAAHAATIFQITGGGNGHGIGMSQYGAYGYALHGQSYQYILGHYYGGTALGNTNPNQVVQVLLGNGQAHFSGANHAAGQKLDPSLTYTVRALTNGTLGLFNSSGKRLAKSSAPFSATGPAPLTLAGHGTYRGALQFSLVGGSVQTVNAVGLDDYVRGVVSAEMPASWPAAALEAQAVAARTYAITDSAGGAGYQLYDDTRSQMYGGVAAETSATDAAVAATSGQIVTYQGKPATTYFFSSSGGHTENIENVWLGDAPQPWLKGVPDPYDGAGADPYHHWRYRMTVAAAQRKLGGLVQGRLRGIRVTKRGVSPRVVDAVVVGTLGVTPVTGPELQSRFGLMSTLMRFTTISAATVHRKPASRAAAFEHARSPFLGPATLHGTVYPASKGASVDVQRLTRRGWHTVGRIRVASRGSYSAPLSPGTYRVLYQQVAGPTVTVA